MRKPAFCICENKDADQLRGNREADQRLRFRYTDSTIPLLPKSEISSLKMSSVLYSPVYVGPGRKPRKQVFSRHEKTCFRHMRAGKAHISLISIFVFAPQTVLCPKIQIDSITEQKDFSLPWPESKKTGFLVPGLNRYCIAFPSFE